MYHIIKLCSTIIVTYMLNGYEKHKMSTESRRKLNKGESLEVKGDSLEVKEHFKTVYPME